jgi:A/G-specific adenine glycosylase
MQKLEFDKKLIRWWMKNRRKFVWRETKDPYKILVSEILLHRTRAKQVTFFYSELIHKYPTLEKLAAADEKQLTELLRPLGLLWRTKLLRLAAQTLITDYGGNIPHSKKDLLKLPGIDQYIASAVVCFAFGQPEPILDTNTVRILGRVFGISTSDSSRRSQLFIGLYTSLLDFKSPRKFNYAMLDLAALVCKPYKPKCQECPVLKLCNYGSLYGG